MAVQEYGSDDSIRAKTLIDDSSSTDKKKKGLRRFSLLIISRALVSMVHFYERLCYVQL